MKLTTIALLTAATALAAAPLRAETHFSIGFHFGVPAYVPARPVFVAPPPLIVRAAPPTIVYAPAPGYWKDVVVRTWIPERWLLTRDRFGRTVRICEPGYTACRTERVWVDVSAPFRPAGYRDGHTIATPYDHHRR